MNAFVEAIGKFITAAWDMIAALHRLLAALAQRDIEAAKLDWKSRTKRHVHDWHYTGRSGTGWGIVRCRSCPANDLY